MVGLPILQCHTRVVGKDLERTVVEHLVQDDTDDLLCPQIDSPRAGVVVDAGQPDAAENGVFVRQGAQHVQQRGAAFDRADFLIQRVDLHHVRQ